MTANTPNTGANRIWVRIVALVLALAATIGITTMIARDSAAAAPVSDNQDPGRAFTAEEEEAVAATRRLYQAWGLEFPNVIIRFHSDSNEGCKGDAGLYRRWVEGLPTVDVCYPGDDPEIAHLLRARVLWHELAHAYVQPRVDEVTKASFLDQLGLQSWMADDWGASGAEYAAEIFVWGTMGGAYNLMMDDMDCKTKSAGFTILTGFEGPAC